MTLGSNDRVSDPMHRVDGQGELEVANVEEYTFGVLNSQVCKYDDFFRPEFLSWRRELSRYHPLPDEGPPVTVHRKMWELLFILTALDERGFLAEGKSGIGFGVGIEPLVAPFASKGCSIVATDLDPEVAEARGWMETGVEYARSLHELNKYGLCEPIVFERRVKYVYEDMNELIGEHGTFDFSWSSCAFEHLGSIEAGLAFIVEQMKYVQPGGVSVHTTELNVSSRQRTIKNGGTVLFRRRDMKMLAQRLKALGYEIELDLSLGTTPDDRYVDAPPFTSDVHLKIKLDNFVSTSVGLIIRKPE